MRGLVAIISHDKTVAVDESEVADLASVFESLRGVSHRESASAGRSPALCEWLPTGEAMSSPTEPRGSRPTA